MRLILLAELPPAITPLTFPPLLSQLVIRPAHLRPESFDPATQGWELRDGGVTMTGEDMRFVGPLQFPAGSRLYGGRIFGRGTPGTGATITVEDDGTTIATGATDGTRPVLTFVGVAYVVRPGARYRIVVTFVGSPGLPPGARPSFDFAEIFYGLPTARVRLLDQPYRAYDSRLSPESKLNPGEDRELSFLPLSELLPSVPYGVVANVTLTETEGDGGYVTCYATNTLVPPTSNLNWTAPDQNIANTVVSAVNNSALTIRGGVNRTHVVVDVTGFVL
jgi:hypothetical protein